MAWNRWFHVTVLFVVSQRFCTVAIQQCANKGSIYGMMLRNYTFHKMRTNGVHECLYACDIDVRCQSFNFVIPKKYCELNNRTKEARPEDFVSNEERYYMERDRKRVPLGSIPELPAESCKEIKSSEGGEAVNGTYWFDSILPGKTVLAYCDMKTEDIDECSASPPVCDVNATCQNIQGSYNCTCNAGLTGDGHSCVDSHGLNSSILVNLDHKYLEQLISYLDPVLNDSVRSKFVRCHHTKTEGWAASTFHSNCDWKGPTVTIIQVNSYIFGAYTNVALYSSGCDWSAASKAFIFSLYNSRGYAPVKLTQYQNQERAMLGCSAYGPAFGDGPNIYITNDANSKSDSFSFLGGTYLPPSGCKYQDSCSNSFLAGNNFFTPTDYEVFYETTS